MTPYMKKKISLLVTIQDYIADFTVRRVGQFTEQVVMFGLSPWGGHNKTTANGTVFFSNFRVATSAFFVRVCVVNDG